jgi:Ca2+-binding RTX toxin-like protein
MPAQAAEVTVNEDTLDTTFTAGPGEQNNLEVRFVTIDEDNNTGTPEIPVIEYHDFDAPVTTPTSDYCERDGENTVYCFRIDELNALATINLGDGDDLLRQGTPGRDAISGGQGNDRLVGLAGNDLIDGGDGDDTLEDPEKAGCGNEGGSLGADILIGGPGTDTLEQICRSTNVTITLDEQANDGSEGEGDNVGSDIEVIEGPGYDNGMRFVGNDLPNVVKGGGLPNVLIGNGGSDRIYGGVDDDELDGGAGDDIVQGWGGADLVDGGTGNDDLSGEGGSTNTDRTGGADTIMARDGFADTIACGTHADRAVVDQLDLVPEPGGIETCESVERESVDDGGGNGGGGGATASTIALAGKSAKVKNGRVPLSLVCTGSAACAGSLALTTASAVASGRKRKRLVAGGRFSVAAGKRKTVKVALNRTGRKLLRRKKSLRVVVTMKMAGQKARTARLTLKR